MPPLRPQLKNQPKKKVIRKPKTPDDTPFGLIEKIVISFNEIKADFIKRIKTIENQWETLQEKIFSDAKKIIENQWKALQQKIIDDVNNHLDTVKKGDKGDFIKGDKGDFVKGDKGDSIQGKPGPKGDSIKGDKGDSIQGKPGKDAILTFDIFKKFIKKIKFKISDVEGLEEELRNISNKASKAIQFGGAGGGGQGSWKQKTLTGAIDGSNTVFTFTGEQPAEFSERVFLNYIEQNPFTDYTVSGTTITYTVAPDASLSEFPHIIRFM